MEQNEGGSGRAPGEPTGGVDVLNRQLVVGDVVMLQPGTMLGLYTVYSVTPILDPNFPPGSRKVTLMSQLHPVTAPNANVIPVIKVSGGPAVRDTPPMPPLIKES